MAVFIGREDSLTIFRQTMECLKPQNTVTAVSNWFSKKDTPQTKQIFMFDGEGGFGKTTLTTQCLKIAKEICKQNHKAVRLDFQDYFLKKGFKEKNSRTIISALYTHLMNDEQLKLKSYFSKYEEVLQKVEEVEKKVKEVKEEEGISDKLSGLASEGISTLIDSQLPGVGTMTKGFTKQASKMGVDKAGEYFNARLEKKLLKEDLDLYRNSDKVLTDKLADGLVEASQAQPILLVLDTFEEIDNTDIDSWLFTSFFKAIYQREATNKIIIVITGRKNHKEDYKNAGLDMDLLYHKTLKEFSQEEVKIFAEKDGLTLSEGQVKKLTTYTSGIPLVLENVFQYLKEQQTESYDTFINELRQHSGTSSKIFKGLVERFLRYSTEDIEKERLYYLAFLPELDTSILAQVWECSEEEVITIIDALAEKHSFIDSEGKLHNKVAEHLQKHLLNSPKIEWQAKEYTQKLARAYHAKLEEYRAKWDITECYQDVRFCKTVLYHLSMLLRKHEDEAFTYLPAYWLEAFEFNFGLGVELFSIPFILKNEATGAERVIKNHGLLHNYEPYLQERYKHEIKLYQEATKYLNAFLFNKQTKNSLVFSDKVLQPLNKLLDKFKTQNGKYHLTPFQIQLLQLRFAEYCCYVKQTDKAFQTLSEIGVLGIQVLDKSVGYYFDAVGTLYEQTKSYEKAVTCFLKAIEKEKWEAYLKLGNLYLVLKDHLKATAYYEKAIEKEEWRAYSGLGFLYQNVLKDYPKAIAYYEKALEAKVWGTYFGLGNLYRDVLKDYPKAISSYEKALEKEKWGAYLNLGNLYRDALKDYSKAIAYYEKALEKEKWGAYLNLGGLYQEVFKDYPKATAYYEKALEKEEWGAYFNLGILYTNVFKDYPNATVSYEEAIEKEDWAAYIGLGNLYEWVWKDYHKAKEYYEKAIEKEQWGAYLNLGNLYNENFKEYAQAIAYYEKALEKDELRAYLNLANLYYFEENLPEKGLKFAQEGISKIEVLLEKEPKNEEYYAMLAGLHTLSEDKELFYEHLNKAVEYGYKPSDEIERYSRSVQRYFPEEAFQALIQKSKEPLM